MPSLHPFAAYIEQNQSKWIDRLRTAVAIPSISADPAHRPDCVAMVHWLQAECESLGIQTQLVPLGNHFVGDQELTLPPVILGTLGTDPKKRTILVYAHADVQPAA